MFYTFVDKLGNRIFHRYVDDQGVRHEEVIDGYPIEMFTFGKTKDAKSLDGRSLSRVSFNDIKDAQEFIRNYKDTIKIFGQTSLAHQYISHTYPEDINVDISKLVVLNFDIEVRHDDGFPHAHTAKDEILSISMKVFGKDKFITLGTKDYTPKNPKNVYVKCNNEKHLLNTFLGFWKTIRPDIITGWNIQGFDIPYLVNRIKRTLGDDAVLQLSPFQAYFKNSKYVIADREIKDGRGARTYSILGVTSFDYLELYKKFNPEKLESYKLDFVGEFEGVGKKVDYSEYGNNLMRLYNENYEKFVEYNEQDVMLVELIDNKKEFVRLGMSVATMTKSRLSEIFGTVKIWDNLVYNMLKKDGIVVPPENFGAEAKDFIGGFVKEPKPGRYKWIVSLDLTSLYPSIIRMYNMSPETIVRDAMGTQDWLAKMLRMEPVTEEAKAEGCSMAANGTIYRQDIEGILPRAMTFVFEERKRYKKLMLEAKKEKEKFLKDNKNATEDEIKVYDSKISMLNATQLALKVVANGGYGAIANTAFRYFNPEIAEGITLTGQMTIQYIETKINAFVNLLLGTEDVDYVVTMDTDSVYVTLEKWVDTLGLTDNQQIVDKIDELVKTKIEPMLNQEYQALANYVGAKKNLMDMKREAIGDIGIFRGKKNYILQVYDLEGVRYTTPELKMTGIETARSSTPRIVRDELEECLKVIVNGTNNDLFKRIENFREKFNTSPLYAIAFPRGVSEIEKWINNGPIPYKKGTPIHVKATIFHNKLIRDNVNLHKKYEQIKEGNKIKFIYLKEPNHLRSNAIAFVEELPTEFGLDDSIDKVLQFEKCFLNPLKSFTDLVNWKIEKKPTLEDLF